MNELVVRSLLAGLFWGYWPLAMNRSGLTGNFSSLIFAGGVLILVFPFALWSGPGTMVAAVGWRWAATAALAGGIGLLMFNGMLAKAPTTDVGRYFLVMLLVQLMVPAVTQIVVSRSLPVGRGVGLVAAFVAVVLLA
jgi:hypothetical protein